MTRDQMLAWLQPGDVLLYSTKGFVSFWIKVKTWSDKTHVELYLGDGKTAAARGPNDGKGGVQTYDFRETDLVLVLRPNVPFDIERMKAFHESCVGQKYDMWGLLRVFCFRGKSEQGKAYCSEHVARMCRLKNGGPGMINECADCDDQAPADCERSPHFNWWTVEEFGFVPVWMLQTEVAW